jgi:uncharacterized protein YbcI
MCGTVAGEERYRKRLRAPGGGVIHQRQSDGDHADRATDGQRASAISTAVVSLFAEYLGRGPTRARTSFGRDVVTVILEETLTKAERRLVEEGESDAVINTRRIFQRTMREDLIAAVEQIMGRRVAGFLSDQSTDPDVSAEIFVLEPERDGADSRA